MPVVTPATRGIARVTVPPKVWPAGVPRRCSLTGSSPNSPKVVEEMDERH